MASPTGMFALLLVVVLRLLPIIASTTPVQTNTTATTATTLAQNNTAATTMAQTNTTATTLAQSNTTTTTQAQSNTTATTPTQTNTEATTQSTKAGPTRNTKLGPTPSSYTAPTEGVIATPSRNAKLSSYPDCDKLQGLTGCVCASNQDTDDGVITLNRGEHNITTCLDSLSNTGYTTFYELSILRQDPISLTSSFLRGLKFKRLDFSVTTIEEIDPNFLGSSTTETEYIEFKSCPLPHFPRMNADTLTTLLVGLSIKQREPIPHLKKNTFAGTPALETLIIDNKAISLTLPRGVFRPLTNLRTVNIDGSVQVKFGAAHFTSRHLETIQLGILSIYNYTFDAGSLAGIPVGAQIVLKGTVSGGWQPTVFFNTLRVGATLNVTSTQDCGCDLAWIRYSGFLDQVTMECRKDGEETEPLKKVNLSHCKFEQSLVRNEL